MREQLSRLALGLQQSMAAKIILGLVLLGFIASLFPEAASHDYDYEVGTIWNEEDLIAPFAFPIYRDAEAIEQDYEKARKATPRSFSRVDSIKRITIDSASRVLMAYAGICDKIKKRYPRNSADDLSKRKLDTLNILASRRSLPILKESGWEYLLKNRDPRISLLTFPAILKEIKASTSFVCDNGFLDKDKDWFEQTEIAIVTGDEETLMPLSSFFDKNDVAQYLTNTYKTDDNSATNVGLLAATISYTVLQPNIVYNQENTTIAIQNSIAKVPRTLGIVKKNERIISRHERVSEQIKYNLDSYFKAKADRTGEGNQFLQLLGKIGHTGAILFLLVIYLFQFRKRIFTKNSDLLIIALLIAFVSIMAYLSIEITVSAPIQYLILVPAASMLLTIIFDSRVAFYATVVMALLVGAIRGNDYSIILASILAGALALYTVRDIKHRTQIFRSLAFVFLGYGFTIVVEGLQRALPIISIGEDALYALGNAIVSPVLTFGLLIFFEKVFAKTTDLTLLELSDFNHTLLRDLSNKAPGTFHHSIVMGTLAESAASAINANPILARVGAYYHDIGKSVDPEYFVENQQSGSNLHDTLEPQQSAHKIIDHVTLGIKLAEEHRLPERVIDFIPGHHGTTLVSYFFEKARRNDPETSELLYRYGGPKPNSKETGIVMLADTVEAAARTIEEPGSEKFEKLIEGVIQQRLADGQLDDCDLTLRDLREIKKSFLTILLGIHHNRIKYPSKNAEIEAKKEFEKSNKLLNFPSSTESLSNRIKKLRSFLE
jgi:cyclic-di-AMP phosphodiesterase PgpH